MWFTFSAQGVGCMRITKLCVLCGVKHTTRSCQVGCWNERNTPRRVSPFFSTAGHLRSASWLVAGTGKFTHSCDTWLLFKKTSNLYHIFLSQPLTDNLDAQGYTFLWFIFTVFLNVLMIWNSSNENTFCVQRTGSFFTELEVIYSMLRDTLPDWIMNYYHSGDLCTYYICPSASL